MPAHAGIPGSPHRPSGRAAHRELGDGMSSQVHASTMWHVGQTRMEKTQGFEALRDS